MKKIAVCLSLATLLLSGVGCGDMNADQTEGQGYQRDQTGYGIDRDGTGMGAANYGRKGRETERYGTYQDQVPGQGTAQRTGRGTGQRRGTTGFSQGITGDDRPGMVDDNGLLNGNLGGATRGQEQDLNRGTRGRDNMHGGTSIPRNQPRNQEGAQGQQNGNGYYDSDDGKMARKIEKRVENVNGIEDADVVVNGDDVLIGVETEENNNQLEERVRSAVKKVDDDKEVHVVTEEEGLNRIRDMGNDLRAGEPIEEIGSTFNSMIDDLGDAIQRPFERSR